MVVDSYRLTGSATRSTVAAGAAVLSMTRHAAGQRARALEDQTVRAGWRRNRHRGPRYLPPYFPSDVS